MMRKREWQSVSRKANPKTFRVFLFIGIILFVSLLLNIFSSFVLVPRGQGLSGAKEPLDKRAFILMAVMVMACFLIDGMTMVFKKRKNRSARRAGITNDGENLIISNFAEPHLPTDRQPTELEWRMHRMWEYKTQYFLRKIEQSASGYTLLILMIIFTLPLAPIYLPIFICSSKNRWEKYDVDRIAFSGEENNQIVYGRFLENFSNVYFEKNIVGKSVLGVSGAPGLYGNELPRNYFFLSATYKGRPFEMAYILEGKMKVDNKVIRDIKNEHCLRFTVEKTASSPVVIVAEKGSEDVKKYFRNERLPDIEIENEIFNRFFAVYSPSAYDVFYILTPKVIDFLNALFLVGEGVEINQNISIIYEKNTVTVYASGSDAYFIYGTIFEKGLPPNLRQIDRGIAFIRDFMDPFID